MNIPLMFRYFWYGTFDFIENETIINMDVVNSNWYNSDGNHEKFLSLVQSEDIQN